jgi:hypothetical protein
MGKTTKTAAEKKALILAAASSVWTRADFTARGQK